MCLVEATTIMTLNWNSLVEGIAAGVAASVLITIFVISRDALRNVFLRIKFMRAFRLPSCGTRALDGVTLGLSNQIGKVFIVRDVVMVTDRGDYRFNPTGEVTSSFKGQYKKPTRKQLRMLKKRQIKSIPIRKEYQFRSWRTGPTPEGFTELRPFTNQEFLLPTPLITDFDARISAFRVTLEYENWTHNTKIIQVRTRGSVDQMHARIEQLKKAIRNRPDQPQST